MRRNRSACAAETLPARARAPPKSAGTPVWRCTQSSINALPGPVSKARSCPSAPDPRQIGDAPDIEDRERLWQPGARTRGRAARAAPPLRLLRHRPSGNPRPHPPRAGAPAPRRRRFARCAARPGDGGSCARGSRQARSRFGVAAQKLLDRIAMEASELFFHFQNRAGSAENRAQSFAKLPPVGDRHPGAGVTRSPPSVSINATSMPSSEVPLINPSARHSRGVSAERGERGRGGDPAIRFRGKEEGKRGRGLLWPGRRLC